MSDNLSCIASHNAMQNGHFAIQVPRCFAVIVQRTIVLYKGQFIAFKTAMLNVDSKLFPDYTQVIEMSLIPVFIEHFLACFSVVLKIHVTTQLQYSQVECLLSKF